MARHKELGTININGKSTKVYVRTEGNSMVFWARIGEIVVESTNPQELANQAEQVSLALAKATFEPARLVRITNKVSGISIETLDVQTAKVGDYDLVKINENIRRLETGMVSENLFQTVKEAGYTPDLTALDEAFNGLVEAIQ